MRKTILPALRSEIDAEGEWLQLDTASVEVTSEEPNHPIEHALTCRNAGGWRAATAGEQLIRLAFDEPVDVRRIQLRFVETNVERTQEFSLRWYDAKGSCSSIVRQQWNFSPAGSTTEVEDFHIVLDGVAKIELAIQPGSQPGAVATLDCLRIA
ncbi:MAG TPA: hypothetical protein VHW24_22090 [Bryobacteraceae bacterium]|jgi:hypothetical protein|nr:hypothetical protein [Bryobacteraceae bacterium]